MRRLFLSLAALICLGAFVGCRCSGGVCDCYGYCCYPPCYGPCGTGTGMGNGGGCGCGSHGGGTLSPGGPGGTIMPYAANAPAGEPPATLPADTINVNKSLPNATKH